jgi:hypothetical protein
MFSKDDYGSDCGGLGAKDNVYAVAFSPGWYGSTIKIELVASFRPVIYARTTACIGNAAWCVAGTSLTIDNASHANTFFVVVDGLTSEDQGDYVLSVTVQ